MDTGNNPLIKILNATAAGAQKIYASFLSKTATKFWSSEGSINSPMTCSRDWVAEWELFQLEDDPDSGKQLIKSRKLKAYAGLKSNAGNTLRCDQNTPVIDALFDVDLTRGTVKAANGMYVTNPLTGGDLAATSIVRAPYNIFQVQAVTITNLDGTLFAQAVRGPNRIAMAPGKNDYFYIMTDDDGDTYLETSAWEFVDAHDNTLNVPVTFAKTPIDTNNYLMKLVPVSDGIVSFQMSAAHDKFINWATSSDGTFLYCNAADNTVPSAQFRIAAALGIL
jgi:hypothetical protein